MNTLSATQINFFKKNSILHLKEFIPKSICRQARNYFLDNESSIIRDYSQYPRGLVAEKIGNTQLIKYFEYPIHFNAFLYGRFLTSDLFAIANQLLEAPVRYVSAEIHTRFSGASEIPMHQDNAYYGLIHGQALTFYIALDRQLPSCGGLKYISNPITDELIHVPCNSTAFSLAIKDKDLTLGRDIIQIPFEPGDCTIHHSRSIHFADPVPLNSERSTVFRISLYSTIDSKRKGHDEWYKNIISQNRSSQGS